MISIGDYYYIGKSLSIFDRYKSHYTLLKQNKHHSPLLQAKYNEYGVTKFTFSILEYISSTEHKKCTKLKGKEFDDYFNKLLLKREKYWMSLYSINYSLNADNKHFN